MSKWTCCFCKEEEDSFDNDDDEFPYMYCTCCGQPTTFFHADKSVCLKNLRAQRETANEKGEEEEEENVTQRTKAMQKAHRLVQYKGEHYFYNCDNCERLECFGCKMASSTRLEPHNIKRLRASLCAACGKKASCAHRLDGKDYTKNSIRDLYLCSKKCREAYTSPNKSDNDAGTSGMAEVKITDNQRKQLTLAIEKFKKDAKEKSKRRRETLNSRKELLQWSEYVMEGDDKSMSLTGEGTRLLERIIPESIHFSQLWSSAPGKIYALSKEKNTDEKDTDLKLFLGYVKDQMVLAAGNLRENIIAMKEKGGIDTDDHQELLEMQQAVYNFLSDTFHYLPDIDDFPQTPDAAKPVGVGGAELFDICKRYFTKYKKEDESEKDVDEKAKSWTSEAEAIRATSAAERNALFHAVLNKIEDNEATLVLEKEDDEKRLQLANNYSYSVLNKPAWPIVHTQNNDSRVCVKVTYWQWLWYNTHRTVGPEESELTLVENTFKNIVFEDSNTFPDPEKEEEDDATTEEEDNDATTLTSEAFNAYVKAQVEQWQKWYVDPSFPKDEATFDGVPSSWPTKKDGSTLDQEHEKRLRSQLKLCSQKLKESYTTSVLPDNFDPFAGFERINDVSNFDEMAKEDAEIRARAALSVLAAKIRPKMKIYLKTMKQEYTEAYSSVRQKVQNAYEKKKKQYAGDLKNISKEWEALNKLQKDSKYKFTKNNTSAKIFVNVMEVDECYTAVKDYIKSCAKDSNMEEKTVKHFELIKENWNKYKKNHAAKIWTFAKTKLEIIKTKYLKEEHGKEFSFRKYAIQAVIERKKTLKESKLEVEKKKARNVDKYKDFLDTKLPQEEKVKTAKTAFIEARSNTRSMLNEIFHELFSEFMKYYNVEKDAEYTDEEWFPELSKGTTVYTRQNLEEAEADLYDATNIKNSIEERVTEWKAQLDDEVEQNKTEALEKKVQLCNKYFADELKKPLMKEKRKIMKAYGRWTMFDHINNVRFRDCIAKPAQKRAYKMDHTVFVEWENTSLKKYMTYYDNAFNPKNNIEKKKTLRKLYFPKEAKEGRLIALRQIRDAAVSEWGRLIKAFQTRWKDNDNKGLEKCRAALRKVFRETGWMKKVRRNESVDSSVGGEFQDKWHYDDKGDDATKQPAIFDTEGKWTQYAKDDAIFGVKEEDRRPPPLVSSKDGHNIDVMKATYCPHCGLQGSATFPVYDVPYPDMNFPNRNMYPAAIINDKDVQFCGIGTEYHLNAEVQQKARLHFAVEVALRDDYIKQLNRFTTLQRVPVGSYYEPTLPKGGCLAAFTREQATTQLKTLRENHAKEGELWQRDREMWQKAVQAEGVKNEKLFLVDVRDALWKEKTVRAPPGYRLVQYPKEGYTWQLEPFYDPLSTSMLQIDEDGKMYWTPKDEENKMLSGALVSLQEMCKDVSVVKFNAKIVDAIHKSQFQPSDSLSRRGAEQSTSSGKPYAWTLPVAPALDAKEDETLNGVQDDLLKKARQMLKIVDGTLNGQMWIEEDGDTDLRWYVKDEAAGEDLSQRLALRRDCFLAQQHIVYERCQKKLSRFLIRQNKDQFKKLYRRRVKSSFIDKKMEMFQSVSCMHDRYVHGERPNQSAAAASREEVQAWMHSVLFDEPLRMYECKRSGKPCIYVEGGSNNTTCENIAACRKSSPPTTNTHFVTRQQFDIETNKDVLSNIKLFQDKNVVVSGTGESFAAAMGLTAGESDKGKDEGTKTGEDSDMDEGSDLEDDKEDGLTDEMKNQGWYYDATFEQYFKGSTRTDIRPVKGSDGTYYSVEDLDEKAVDRLSNDEQGDFLGGPDNEQGSSSSGEEELSDSEGEDSESDNTYAPKKEQLEILKNRAKHPGSQYVERQGTGGGALCAIHATNNFLELEEGKRYDLTLFKELEPGRSSWFGTKAFGQIFRDISVEVTYNNPIPESGALWNDLHTNENFLGFLAKPFTKRWTETQEKEYQSMLQKSEEVASERLALEQLILKKSFDYLGDTFAFPNRKTLTMDEYKTLKDTIELISAKGAEPTMRANLLSAIDSILEMKKLEQTSKLELSEKIQKRDVTEGGHWVAVRKYKQEYFEINSMGSKVTSWEGTWEQLKDEYYTDKMFIFATSDAARAWQEKLGHDDRRVVGLKRQEVASDMAETLEKKYFGTEEEKRAAARLGAAPGVLFRMISARYI